MRNQRIFLLAFLFLGLFSFLGLIVLHMIFFAGQSWTMGHPSAFGFLWLFGSAGLAAIPMEGPKDWLLRARLPLLLGTALWPFLDGFLFLNDMASFHEVPWAMDAVVLGFLLAMSVSGMALSLRCGQPKEREMAFLCSLCIGASALWEYFRFGNFGYASFLFAGLTVVKLVAPQKESEAE